MPVIDGHLACSVRLAICRFHKKRCWGNYVCHDILKAGMAKLIRMADSCSMQMLSDLLSMAIKWKWVILTANSCSLLICSIMRRGCGRRLFLGPEGPPLSCPFTSTVSWVSENPYPTYRDRKHQREHLFVMIQDVSCKDKVSCNYRQHTVIILSHHWSLCLYDGGYKMLSHVFLYKWSSVTRPVRKQHHKSNTTDMLEKALDRHACLH